MEDTRTYIRATWPICSRLFESWLQLLGTVALNALQWSTQVRHLRCAESVCTKQAGVLR